MNGEGIAMVKLLDASKNIITLIGILVFFCLPVRVFADEESVLYVREGCSHCENVEKFIEENSLENKIEVKDITLDSGASESYTEFMERNEVPLSERGAVPVLTYDESHWVSGDTPIIEYLAEKYGIEIKETEREKTSDALLVGGGTVFAFIVGYGIVKMVYERREH